MTNQPDGHLAEERIQAFLDDRLPAEERAGVQDHLDRCAGCRTRYEVWQGVFTRLEGLPEMAPSPDFARRVMEKLPVRRPVTERIRDWLRGLRPASRPGFEHLGPDLVLGYLDRALPRRRRSRVESHLEGCAACREEVSEWREVFVALEGLDRFRPSEGFADAVLTRVRMPDRAPAPAARPALPERIAGWVEKLSPRTRKGWAAAGVAAAAPALALVTGGLALFSNPLLTPAHLVTFLWWEVSGATTALAGGAVQRLMESPALYQLWEAVQTFAGSPTLVGGSALAFSASTLVALWVLYRNLISTPTVERGYANVSA